MDNHVVACKECGQIEYDPQCQTCCNEMNTQSREVKFMGPKASAEALHEIAELVKRSESTHRSANNGTTR